MTITPARDRTESGEPYSGADGADALGRSEAARIALRRHFEDVREGVRLLSPGTSSFRTTVIPAP